MCQKQGFAADFDLSSTAEKEIKSLRKERLLVLEKTCIYKGPASIKKKKNILSFWAVKTMLASSNAVFLWK